METVILTHKAARDLEQLTSEARFMLLQALNEFAMSVRGDAQKLSRRDGFRHRVGRWRVLFDDDGVTILAICFGKRETSTCKRHQE